MEQQNKIYLHFAGNLDELDPWNSEFSYYLSVVLKHIMGFAPVLVSNIDVSGAKQTKIDPADIDSKTTIVLIFNSKKTTLDADSFSGFLDSAAKENKCLVLRTHLKNVQLPDNVKSLPTFNFFEVNPHTFEVSDYISGDSGEKEKNYWQKLTDLAYQIKGGIVNQKNEIAKNNHKTIYLAEVSADQSKNRERLLRDLLLSGYTVLPNKPLPTPLQEFEEMVADMLSESSIMISMIGETYGETPTGSDYSFVEIQNRIFSSMYSKTKDDDDGSEIHRVVWFPPVFAPFDEKQIQYIKRLKKEIVNSRHTELVHSTLFDLKAIVDNRFDLFDDKNIEDSFEGENVLLLISDEHNSHITKLVEEKLLKLGLEFNLLSERPSGEMLLSQIGNEIRKYSRFMVVSSRHNPVWVGSITSILTRFKAYKDFGRRGLIGVFVPEPLKKLPEAIGLNICSYVYSSKNLDEILESFKSRVIYE